MTGEPKLQILRYSEDMAADTGEGARYECSDGSVWKHVQPFCRSEGYLVDGHIIPGPRDWLK